MCVPAELLDFRGAVEAQLKAIDLTPQSRKEDKEEMRKRLSSSVRTSPIGARRRKNSGGSGATLSWAATVGSPSAGRVKTSRPRENRRRDGYLDI
jgi:hypothetical protein